MERVWRYSFEELYAHQNPPSEEQGEDEQERMIDSDLKVVLTEPSLNPRFAREKTVQMMFESFGVQNLFLGQEAGMLVYDHGITTGIACLCGDDVTEAVPIFEGFPLTYAINKQLNSAGKELTKFLSQLLTERAYKFFNLFEREIVRDIKERHCYVTMDYKSELRDSYNNPGKFERHYEMPDGSLISLGNQRFRCTEYLFRPFEMNGLDKPGFQDLIYSSILECDVELRRTMTNNIMLSGGTTLFKNFPDRLRQELNQKLTARALGLSKK